MGVQLIVVCLLVGTAIASPTPGHTVLTVETTNEEQLNVLHLAAGNDHELDFWTHPRLHGLTDVMVPKGRAHELTAQWTAVGMKVKVAQEDVAELIRNVEAADRLYQQRSVARMGTTLAHNVYRSYQSYSNDLQTLQAAFPNLMRFDVSGQSVSRDRSIENRIIHFFEIGANLDNRPVIMLEVNIHAREWMTSASNFYMIDRLLTNYGSDNDATFLLDNFHLVVIPVANPDGYEYSRTNSNNRLWRKNRRNVGGPFSCYGVDLNRNFDASWLASGSCWSETYPGASYHSEPETRAVEAIFNRFEDNMAIYLAVHCYSQILLLPWAYLNTNTPVDQHHVNFGREMAEAMAAVHGLEYDYGTARGTIGYTASGTSGDWALVRKGSTRNFASIAYELRPAAGAGSGGFVLPASEIVPTGEELLASLIAAASHYDSL